VILHICDRKDNTRILLNPISVRKWTRLINSSFFIAKTKTNFILKLFLELEYWKKKLVIIIIIIIIKLIHAELQINYY